MIENFIAYKPKHMENVTTQLFAESRSRFRLKDPNYIFFLHFNSKSYNYDLILIQYFY